MTDHIVGATLAALAAAVWLYCLVRRSRPVAWHVEAALGADTYTNVDFDQHADEAVALGNSWQKCGDQMADQLAAVMGPQVVAAAEELTREAAR